LTSDATGGLALLEKPGLIQNKNRILIGQVSSAYSRTMSRSASASHHPRPRMACWRQGPGSPAASARIQPVLRRSSPSSPSRNKPAEAATRSWVNNGAIRALTARSDDAQSSSVVSIEIPVIHDLRIMVTDGFRRSKKAQL
jgi:hypothetical protein